MSVTATKIIEAADVTDFAAQCVTAIAAGWQPSGGAFARTVGDYPNVKATLCQSFITGIPAGDVAVLDVTAGTGTAEKALVLDANGAVTVPGEVSLDGNKFAVEAGVGITGGVGTVYRSSVVKTGGIIKSSILIDLTGLNGGNAGGDIIGTNGAGVAHLGRITAARNGTILSGTVTCLETPTGSNVDVDVWSADEATGVEDTAISALTGEVQLINHGNWAIGETAAITDIPAPDQYLYLTSGAATSATFTAGKFLIEMFGYDA